MRSDKGEGFYVSDSLAFGLSVFMREKVVLFYSKKFPLNLYFLPYR